MLNCSCKCKLSVRKRLFHLVNTSETHFSLTQVFPIEGCLAEEPREAAYVPKAQVDPLTSQGMHTMGCITAHTATEARLVKCTQLAGRSKFIPTFLPNESHPMSDVLGCVTHAQREHDPTLRADPRHTQRKLSGRACGRHDGRQGATEHRAGRLNQLRLVLVTPLFVGERTETYSRANFKKGVKRDIKKPKILLRGRRNEFTQE